jgi:ubiquinone/menaquinone biosynthesis C-methylase UbiE
MIKSWVEYWNRPNGIFVNEPHKRAHYRIILANVQPFLPRGAGSAVLDWGCGEAFGAETMAAPSERVYLYDPADVVRARLGERYKGHSRITVLDDGQLKRLPLACVDLILINSVIQYISRLELSAALRDLQHLLKPDGRFLIGDVIAPGTPLWRHVIVFLSFAYREGFLVPGMIGLVRNFLPSYKSLARKQGLSNYSEADLLGIFERSGLRGERLPRNISVSPIRASYLAWKAQQGSAKSADGNTGMVGEDACAEAPHGS